MLYVYVLDIKRQCHEICETCSYCEFSVLRVDNVFFAVNSENPSEN
jgi:hypothetical protein